MTRAGNSPEGSSKREEGGKAVTAIARDEAKARAMGVTYGALKAPIVIVRGYAGSLHADSAPSKSAEPRYCPNCGKPVSGHRRIYCDAVCMSQFTSRKYYAKKKARNGGQKEGMQ